MMNLLVCTRRTAQAMSMAGKLVVTVDRDARVRISHYPQAYAIYAFGMGHTE